MTILIIHLKKWLTRYFLWFDLRLDDLKEIKIYLVCSLMELIMLMLLLMINQMKFDNEYWKVN